MFNFLKKAQKQVEIGSPVNGVLKRITDVSDPMFAQKIMGDGYAVVPMSDNIYSPVSGIITNVFPTKHAISFETAEGLNILLHLGVDTVELKGKPFNLQVVEGQSINEGDLLGTMDQKQIEISGKSNELIIIFTNMEVTKEITEILSGKVEHGDVIGKVILK
jgi:PTS system glucose-specific IIA component